jgi:hypothetical protein
MDEMSRQFAWTYRTSDGKAVFQIVPSRPRIFVTARRCNLVCDSQDEVEDRDGMAAGFGIVDRR